MIYIEKNKNFNLKSYCDLASSKRVTKQPCFSAFESL